MNSMNSEIDMVSKHINVKSNFFRDSLDLSWKNHVLPYHTDIPSRHIRLGTRLAGFDASLSVSWNKLNAGGGIVARLTAVPKQLFSSLI